MMAVLKDNHSCLDSCAPADDNHKNICITGIWPSQLGMEAGKRSEVKIT